jgi:hypothetical protein
MLKGAEAWEADTPLLRPLSGHAQLESSDRTAGVRGETRLPLAASLDNSLLELNVGNGEEEEEERSG